MKLAQDQSQIKRIRIWNQVCLASTLRSTISRRLCWISLKVASPATFGRECSEPWPLSPSSTHRFHPRQTDAKPRKGPLMSLPMIHHQRLSFHLFYPKSTFHDTDLNNKTCRTLLLVILTQSFIFFFFFFWISPTASENGQRPDLTETNYFFKTHRSIHGEKKARRQS